MEKVPMILKSLQELRLNKIIINESIRLMRMTDKPEQETTQKSNFSHKPNLLKRDVIIKNYYHSIEKINKITLV